VIDATIKEALESDVPVTTKIPARLAGFLGVLRQSGMLQAIQ
jgi:hypothetical protein